MALWRRSLRIALILCVLGVGTAVVVGLRNRAEPARALVIERTDPDAVIQTRGSRIVQADAFGENLRVVADRQDTYRDGGLRLVDNVEVTVADREGRAGFVLVSEEATLDAGKTAIALTGSVELRSSDGLSASTAAASYTDGNGVIRMPGPSTFTREGMEAAGDRAEYDRRRDVLRLLDHAQVDLVSQPNRTRIVSGSAILAQTDRYMEFSDDVVIETDAQQMLAGRARAVLRGENAIEALHLTRDARITGKRPRTGTVKEMRARAIDLTYDETGAALETAVLTDAARIEITGVDGAAGSTIAGRSIDVAFGGNGSEFTELVARTQVGLSLPEQPESPARSIRADQLTVTGQSDAGAERAQFDGAVTFREASPGMDGAPSVRLTRADRLDAALSDGMARLGDARFLGNVTFENGDVVGAADEAMYAIDEGRVELMISDPTGRTPRIEDRRGSIQANLITLGLSDSQVTAAGEVESVLVTAPADADTGADARRPGLLEPREPTYVTAGHLAYDETTQVAVYSEGARLWQAATEFVGDTIVLDEVEGNISAEGSVRTRSRLSQVSDETGLPEESTTIGRADRFTYDDALHRAVYTSHALVRGPRGDLAADEISLFLMPDDRTLDRIEATGHVVLTMPGRSVTGRALVYRDADGRYEMEGGPVRIIEEMEDHCRETTGRTLTFFLTDDAVSVDGQSEVRTETLRGSCPQLTPGVLAP